MQTFLKLFENKLSSIYLNLSRVITKTNKKGRQAEREDCRLPRGRENKSFRECDGISSLVIKQQGCRSFEMMVKAVRMKENLNGGEERNKFRCEAT